MKAPSAGGSAGAPGDAAGGGLELPGEARLTTGGRTLRLQLSVHDVMPATLQRVESILSSLGGLAPAEVTLLVVPGAGWAPPQVERLRCWARAGYRFAGHGWRHEISSFGGWRHRLHGALLSRRVAEHLELDAAAIVALMKRNRAWFAAAGLPTPVLYVPPAWALGPVADAALGETGFRYVETLSSVTDLQTGRRERVPLLGFEAHGVLQSVMLRSSNAANAAAGHLLGRLRIAVHPHDPELRLAGDLTRWLQRVNR